MRSDAEIVAGVAVYAAGAGPSFLLMPYRDAKRGRAHSPERRTRSSGDPMPMLVPLVDVDCSSD